MKKETNAVIEALGMLVVALVALAMAFVKETRMIALPSADAGDDDDDDAETPAQKKKRLAAEKAAKAKKAAADDDDDDDDAETPAQKKKRLAAEKAAKAKKAAAEEDDDDDDADDDDDDDDGPTLEQLRKIAKPLVKEGRTAEIKEVLEPYDAETLTELDKKHYAKVLKKLKAL